MNQEQNHQNDENSLAADSAADAEPSAELAGESVAETSAEAPTIHPATLELDALLEQCKTRRGRSSGPGGQHRNKVETAVEITHEPTGIVGWASERRSQADNQKVAVFRLRVALAVAHRAGYALGAEPSDLWRSRIHGGRIEVNPSHQDFPALLAESLDVIHTLRFDLKAASMVLSCTASQLVRFLKKEPAAIEQVNVRRKQLGLRVMK